MSEEALDKDASPWTVPAIDGSEGKGYLTAGRLEALQKEAWDEAYQKGHAEGVKAGEEEIAARARRYDQLLQALSKPFDRLDEEVEKELVELAIAMTKQLFRREIRINPSHVIGVVREAIRLLPVASRNVHVHLHPEDAALVRDTLTPAENEPAWTIVEDPLIERGGCNVTTDNSRVDATNEKRLQAAIRSLNGDERQ
ncbi:MAG: FliH/SctL family protein [Woeseiaceae bacterium]|nr:FliH/SctL family protein [Woeseiaceae bacterium]